jgi:hypothetical protein
MDSAGREEAGTTGGSTDDVDDVKRKFREALERKHGNRSGAAAAAETEGHQKVHDAHGPAHTQRQFRRKSGG